MNNYIIKTNDTLSNQLRVKGHRIPVYLIIECISSGMTMYEITEDYGLEIEVMEGVLKEVAELLKSI